MAENILHFTGVTYRVTGSGTLRTTIKGLDGTTTQTLATYSMTSTPGREPTILANFNGQRALFRVEITAIDEKFNINRMVVFTKPLWSSFPQ